MANESSTKKKNKKDFHISTDIDFEIRSPKLKAARLIAVLVFLTVLVGYHVYQSANDSILEIQTVTAKKENYTKSLKADAFVLRDESYIQGAGSTGHAVPLVKDGTKVSGNDSVVNIFKSEADAQVYYDLLNIESDIAYYESIRNTATVNTLADITAYDEKVEDSIYALIAAIDSKDLAGLSSYADALRTAVTKRSIAVGNSVDVSSALDALLSIHKQLLNKQASFTRIPADVAGYYVQNVDGYEAACGVYSGLPFAQNVKTITERVKDVDCSTVEALLSLEPISVRAPYGKLITGFIWYLVCNVPTAEVEDLYIGQRLRVNFPNEQADSVETKVVAMNANGAGETALILSATAMDAEYANLRQTEIVIDLESYTGFRVHKTAMRVVDGETGVYVLLGNVVRFRKVETIYSEEEFHIVDASGKNGYIKAFDEIILGGTDLYDGKLVQ